MPFAQLGMVHYCRWCVMDNLIDADGKPTPPMLLLQACFDGAIPDFLQTWATQQGGGLDKIYSHCESYPAQPNAQNRVEYLQKYHIKEKLAWTAFQGETVERIKQEAALVQGIQEHLDKNRLHNLPAQDLYANIKAFAQQNYAWALLPPPTHSLGWKIKYYGELALLFLFGALWVASLFVLIASIFWHIALPVFVTAFVLFVPLTLFLVIWILLAKHFENIDNRHIETISPIPKEAVLAKEDLVDLPQNQLTIYGALKNPNWFRRRHIKLFLMIARTSAKYRATKGSLSGVTTIHFASWALFNNDKNVLFTSNYDGGWESYLSEFIDYSASAMNMSFGNIKGYPKIIWLIKKGAHDEQNFKKVVRHNQYACQVWHVAYPQIRAKNILRNQKIRKGLSQKMNEQALRDWLKLL